MCRCALVNWGGYKHHSAAKGRWFAPFRLTQGAQQEVLSLVLQMRGQLSHFQVSHALPPPSMQTVVKMTPCAPI